MLPRDTVAGPRQATAAQPKARSQSKPVTAARKPRCQRVGMTLMKLSRNLARGLNGAALLLGVPLTVLAQGPPTPITVVTTQAQTLLSSGRADSAILVLEAFLRHTPAAPQVRIKLGDAYLHLGDTTKALRAYDAIRGPAPVRAQARFSMARLLAASRQDSAALSELASLKASGVFDMDSARTAAEFRHLKDRAEFTKAMFQPDDFTNPFVEPVRVIHEWVGETRGDQFSWIARGIGDVNGDRIPEVVTSAPTWGPTNGTRGAGKVYVYDGRSGRLLWSRAGEGQERIGTGLDLAGDINRDGAPDVIAGAPGSGRAYVLSGRDGGLLFSLAGSTDESFGASAAGVGDRDGDGFPDVAVGAPSNSDVATGAGRVYVFSGRDGFRITAYSGEAANDAFGSIVAGMPDGRRTPLSIGAPGAGPNRRGAIYLASAERAPEIAFSADSTGAALGAMFTSFLPDLDGDGEPEVWGTDFTNGATGAGTGRAYVFSVGHRRLLLTLTGQVVGEGYGVGAASAGDFDNDGINDLVVGAWQHGSVAASGGRIYVHSGRDGRVLRTITGRIPGETLGFDAVGVDDVDGDGVPDLLVTSSWSNINGFRTGRMFLIAGERSRH